MTFIMVQIVGRRMSICKHRRKRAHSEDMSLTARILSAACLLLCATPEANAFSRRQKCTLRCHMEVDSTQADPFAIQVRLIDPPKQIFVEKAPSLSERQIKAVEVYPAENGSWGAMFLLDNSGRITLSNLSNSNRGRMMVIFVGTEKASRQVVDLEIDAPVSDGFLPIPRGLTYAEALVLKKCFPPLRPERRRR